MGCNHGKTSQPDKLVRTESEKHAKSWDQDTLGSHVKTLLGNEDAASHIKDPNLIPKLSLSSPTAMDAIPLLEDPAANQTHETLAGSTSTEPESEVPGATSPRSPRFGDDADNAHGQETAATCTPDGAAEENSIHGTWNVATIVGTLLTFNSSGETVDIDIVNPTQCRMVWKGHSCTGVLREDGKLHWSDGDVWSRDRQAPVSTAASLANQEKPKVETLRQGASGQRHHAEQNDRSLNLPGGGATAEDVRRAGEAWARIKGEASGKAASEEKPPRKERLSCCC